MTPKVLELAAREGRNPTWAMALLHPDQGGWTVEEYLELDAGRHVEFSDGKVEVLPTPNEQHQYLVMYLLEVLRAFAKSEGGRTVIAPFPMRLWENRFREPDVLFMRHKNLFRCKGAYWEGADLVMEVLSETSRAHDLRTKRAEYEKAKIPEYWIEDPRKGRITILALRGDMYEVHGVFTKGQKAASVLLPGFEVKVTEALKAR